MTPLLMTPGNALLVGAILYVAGLVTMLIFCEKSKYVTIIVSLSVMSGGSFSLAYGFVKSFVR